VVQKFIASSTISEAERKSLRDKKIADQKLRYLLTIITDHCNRDAELVNQMGRSYPFVVDQ
jgi:hypothetical protein